MSRWLKSVNTMLEKLDDRAGTAAGDASNLLLDADGVALSGLTNRFLSNTQSENEDGSYLDDDDDDGDGDDVDDDEFYDNESDMDNIKRSSRESGDELEDEGDGIQPDRSGEKKWDPPPDEAQPIQRSEVEASSEPESISTAKNNKSEPFSSVDFDVVPATEKAAAPVSSDVSSKIASNTSVEVPPPPSSQHATSNRASNNSVKFLPPPPSSQSSSSTKTAARPANRLELQKAQQEVLRLTKLNASLQAQLEASQAELSAQNEELLRAAERIDEDRQLADEEREELLDEHEEALRNLKASYEASLTHQKDTYEKQLEDIRKQLATEAQMRAKEGGDMTEELGECIERERQALRKADQLEQEKAQLELVNGQLSEQGETLREEVKRLKEAAQASADRERQMEERLDAANEMHQRALSHRQAREAELERNVAELGAALALRESGNSRSVTDHAIARMDAGNGSHFDNKYDLIVEELESTKAQLNLSNQKCDALQKELQLISLERTEEASVAQLQEREHNAKVEQLALKIAQLEATLREYKAVSGDLNLGSSSILSEQENPGQNGESVAQLTRDLENSRRHIASLSDQLLRQQGLTESAKSEVLALRGRLQSATSRAEAAEAAGSNGGMYELESGGVGYATNLRQRRVRRSGPQLGRTMRSALGLRTVENSNLEPVAQTVDAVDLWMLQTGVILKHEPLARIGLLFYFTLIHFWCFGLIFFHAVESEHGDLGALTSIGKIHAARPPGQ
ncbi:hypothetical protein ACA910_008646 [Epithemia clementina (nom. ined.)]